VADVVELILELRNVAQFVSGAKQAATSAGNIGTETEKAGKKASSGWKGLAKWAGGATAIYGATRYIKGAVSATEDLAKSTITVSRTTGMDTQTASEWAALTKERGVATKQFQVGLVKLSKTMEASRTGTTKENAAVKALRAQIDAVSAAGGKKAPAEIAKLSKAIEKAQGSGEKARSTLAALGVSQRDVARGNTANVLYKVADALEKMRNPAQRAALMQQLFGKSGQALLPILMKGGAGVRKLLDQQKAAGNYISGKGLKNAKDLIQQQRELNTALAGVKVQLGQALLPVLVQVGRMFVRFMTFIRPLTKNATLFKIAIAALVAAFVAYKIAMTAAALASIFFEESVAPAVLITLGIVAAVALLAIGIYELWKHCKTFRDIVKDVWAAAKVAFAGVLEALKVVWQWVKANWPYLLGALAGPFGLAAVVIVKHIDTIKGYALTAFDAIKGAARTVGHAFVVAFGAVKDAVRGAINFLIRGWNSLQFKIPGFKLGPVHFGGVTLGVPQLPLLATGGNVTAAGAAIVGERGPELVQLPTGATVRPLEAPEPLVAAAAAAPADTGPLRPLEIVVPVMLDGREIARSTARVAANQLARK
jgi:phage-related protein